MREGECLTLDWIDEYGAGEFLRRIVGLRDRRVLTCLERIDWHKQFVALADLCGADLLGANLRNANLLGANLAYANLEGAQVSREQLMQAINVDPKWLS